MRPRKSTVRVGGLVCALVSMPLLLGGCFAMQKDLDPIRSDISVMEKQFMELQREQALLRARLDQMQPGEAAGSAGRPGGMETRMPAAEPVPGVTPGGYEPVAPQPMPPEPVPMAPEPVMVEPLPETQSQPPVLVTPGSSPTAPSRVMMAAEDMYSEAMAAYKAGDLSAAQNGFGRIIDEYPDNRLADNAAYWIGEIQFTGKQYDKAIESFRRVVSDYPIGDKVPDAVYMMGRSYEEMGQTDKAKDAYNRVMDNYPYSDAARNARQRMNGIY